MLHNCLCNTQTLPHTKGIFSNMLAAFRIQSNLLHSFSDLCIFNTPPQSSQKLQVAKTGVVGEKSRCFNNCADIIWDSLASFYVPVTYTPPPLSPRFVVLLLMLPPYI